jgi:hypothetical protein
MKGKENFMKNLAVKYLCTGIVTFVTLCGGMSVSAQNLVVQNPGVLVTKSAGITSVLTPERSIHTDAGLTASLRNARDEAMVTRHKADVVKSANGESEEAVAESDSVSAVSVTESSIPEESEVDSENQENGTETEIEATEQPETYEVIKEYPITDGNTTKTVLPYKAFGKNTNQAKLQSLCQTNEVGLRVYDGRFTIAIGTYFNTAVGQYFDLVLENGTVIPCIMGDLKADIHTDSRGLFTEASGCMTEFIVDRTYLPNKNSATYCYEEWNSKVVNVIVYNKFVNLE